MQRRFLWTVAIVSISCVLGSSVVRAVGDDKATKETKAEKKPGEKAAAKEKKSAGRLPPYYTGIVTDDQREPIAKAYAKFNGKLDKLREEIKTLTAERDKALEELLTAEQRTKLAEAKEEAKAKRNKTAAK